MITTRPPGKQRIRNTIGKILQGWSATLTFFLDRNFSVSFLHTAPHISEEIPLIYGALVHKRCPDQIAISYENKY
jgi:hypothetical protein